MKKLRIVIPIFLLLVACKTIKVPKEKLSQFTLGASHLSYEVVNNQLQLHLVNPLKCPLRVYIDPVDNSFRNLLKATSPIVLGSEKDTTLTLDWPDAGKPELQFSAGLGDPEKKTIFDQLSLPLAKNKPTRIIQGYNGTHSHNNDFSRYAIDFALQIRDTIYSATDGFVVGIIKDYEYGGKSKKWKGYDNFITIYDPFSGLFTQYAHLIYQGTVVEIGDAVHQGDPIGLCGMTGYTDTPHLHFNTLIPQDSNRGLKSVPVEFMAGYKGKDLKRNDLVIR